MERALKGAGGQAAIEFLLCAAVLAAALLLPFIEQQSVASLLAHRVVDCIRGFYLLIALA
jgi:hypothetical protein